MKVIINNIDKTYIDGIPITDRGSHYAFNNFDKVDDIIINLSQIQIHAYMSKTSIEHVLIQHIAHETIHKILRHEISDKACIDFDNIASEKAIKECGTIAFNRWFSGFYEGVKQ